MAENTGGKKALTFAELADSRRKTEVVSKHLHDRLMAHLETLRPVLSPERTLGRYAGGKGESAQADRALAQLQQNYRPFTSRPFDLPNELDLHWLGLVGNRPVMFPWEYVHEAKTDRGPKAVAMTSPVHWILTLSSAYTLAQVKQALSGKGERRPEHVRQFVVNALVMQLVLAQNPGLTALFADLRCQVQTEYAPELPKLPLTTITSMLPSFRPADDLVLAATDVSGVAAFVEIVDVAAVPNLHDPLREEIEKLIA